MSVNSVRCRCMVVWGGLTDSRAWRGCGLSTSASANPLSACSLRSSRCRAAVTAFMHCPAAHRISCVLWWCMRKSPRCAGLRALALAAVHGAATARGSQTLSRLTTVACRTCSRASHRRQCFGSTTPAWTPAGSWPSQIGRPTFRSASQARFMARSVGSDPACMPRLNVCTSSKQGSASYSAAVHL